MSSIKLKNKSSYNVNGDDAKRDCGDTSVLMINFQHCGNLCSSIGIHCMKWGCLKIIEIRNVAINSDCIDGLCCGIKKWGTENTGTADGNQMLK